MRTFQTLDQFDLDPQTGIAHVTCGAAQEANPQLALRQEGDYVVLSASYGALEIGLRLRYNELERTLKHLHPVDGLQTSHQVGTNESFLSLGADSSGSLLLRPTLVGDAAGHISFNLQLTPDAAQALKTWLLG